MRTKQGIAVFDLEGVFLPEIWQHVARSTGIEPLNLTTRDVADYNKLMDLRISTLKRHNISLSYIQNIVKKEVRPFPGAISFLRSLRSAINVILLSDTFTQFFDLLRAEFEYPTVFCNSLVVRNDQIESHTIRMENGKVAAVTALQRLNFQVSAVGDSHNDLGMLSQAHFGAFFNPPASIARKLPTIPVFTDYDALLSALSSFFGLSIRPSD